MASPDPLADEQLLVNDALAARQGPSARDVVRAEMSGDRLEQDLLESGFYGEVEQPGSMVDPAMAIMSFGRALQEMREAAVEDRWSQDQNTLLNFGFKNGYHFIETDRSKRAVVELPAPKGLVRRKVAKFEPWFRSQHGKLSGGTPQSQVVPTTNQMEDRDASDFAEELLEWMRKRAWSHENRSELAMWMLLGGVSVYHVGVRWIPDPEYFQASQGRMPHRPELVFEVLSPMECWTDNKTPQIRKMRWFGRDQYMPEAEARAMYTEREDQDKLTVEAETDPISERGFHTLRQIQRLLYREDPWADFQGPRIPAQTTGEDDVIVSEWWCRENTVLQAPFIHGLAQIQGVTVEVLHDGADGRQPLVRFPNGLRAQFTPEGHVLEVRDNFYGDLPFREFKLSQSAGFWSPAWATPLRELNQAIDWAFSLREQHLMRTAIPPFLEPREANISRRQTASGVGWRVKYDANRFNVKPEWANPPNMPADSIQFMQELEKAWQDIAALHEVSKGELPANISGVAVSLLQEQDLSQLGFAGEELESGFSDVMSMALRRVQEFFPIQDPRIAQLAGNAPYKAFAFMQADLEDGLDIKVQKGSAIPRSAAAVKAEAKELYTMGALVDEFGRPDTKKLLLAYEHGTEDALYAEDEMDKSNARQEEEAILQMDPRLAMRILEIAMEEGALMEPFNLSTFDNHLIHEASHRRRLKRVEGDPRIHPINKKLLEFHWTLTVQAALPILMQTDPDVAAPFLQQLQPGAEEEGGEGGEEGGESAA